MQAWRDAAPRPPREGAGGRALLGKCLGDLLARLLEAQPLPDCRDDPLEPAEDERVAALGLEPPAGSGEAAVDVARGGESRLGIEATECNLERAVVEDGIRVIHRLARQRIETARRAFTADLLLTRNLDERRPPIEVLNSADLLTNARLDLVRAMVAYSQAQLRLYVALGNSPR